MLIHKAILHILDFHSGVSVFSQEEMGLSSDAAQEYIERHLQRIQNDTAKKPGQFLPGSAFAGRLQEYAQGRLSFIELSTIAANILYEQISHADSQDSTDLLAVEFSDDADTYLAFLLLSSREAYTHQVIREGESARAELIRHYAILPGISQKADAYALIRGSDFSVGFSDKKRLVDGKEIFLLPDVLLQCSSQLSPREAVKTISKIAAKVAEDHGASAAAAISRTKNYLMENAETASSFSPAELGRQIFSDAPVLRQDFERQLQESPLPEEVKIEKGQVVRTNKNHKLRTDTGVEITIPAGYFENQDYFELINNPDGTMTIELKNIGKIINR